MNPTYKGLAHAELLADFSLAGAAFQGTYRKRGFASQFGIAAVIGAVAIADPSTSFLGHIGLVVAACSKKVVGRILAWWVIACVADKLRLIPFGVGQLVGHAVRSAQISTLAEKAVAALKAAGFPWPAFVGPSDIDLRPIAGNVSGAKIQGHRGLLFRWCHAPGSFERLRGGFPLSIV